jgi:hypothetical protein
MVVFRDEEQEMETANSRVKSAKRRIMSGLLSILDAGDLPAVQPGQQEQTVVQFYILLNLVNHIRFNPEHS